MIEEINESFLREHRKEWQKTRCMAVADVFDAVSAKRCYRDAMPLEQCFAIIENGSGQDFDPFIADVFLDMKEEITKIVAQEGPK